MGGAFYLENTSLIDTGGSTYTGNAAIKGGAFYCKNCSINTKDSKFDNHEAYQGGIIYLFERTMITFDNLEIVKSYAALNAGFAYAIATSSPTES